MNMQELRHIARDQGIKPGKQGKIDLVRSIQRIEGNFDCFATAREGICDQLECRWRKDCFTLARRGHDA